MPWANRQGQHSHRPERAYSACLGDVAGRSPADLVFTICTGTWTSGVESPGFATCMGDRCGASRGRGLSPTIGRRVAVAHPAHRSTVGRGTEASGFDRIAGQRSEFDLCTRFHGDSRGKPRRPYAGRKPGSRMTAKPASEVGGRAGTRSPLRRKLRVGCLDASWLPATRRPSRGSNVEAPEHRGGGPPCSGLRRAGASGSRIQRRTSANPHVARASRVEVSGTRQAAR